MGTNSVTFELRAEDLGATDAMKRAGGEAVSLQDTIAAREQAAAVRARQHEAAVASAERGQRRLRSAIEGTTTATNLAATVITRMRGLLLGLAQGAVIGAVAALAAQFFATRKNAEDLTKSVVDQATKWDPYRARIEEVSQATVDLYNAELALTKLRKEGGDKEIEKELATLQFRRRQMEALVARSEARGATLGLHGVKERIAETTLEIKKNEIALKDWSRVMGLQPLTLAKVKTAVADAAAVNFWSTQDDLGRKIQETNQEILKQPLAYAALAVAVRENITLTAAYAQVKAAGDVQERAGHTITTRTAELLAQGGIMVDLYTEALQRGLPAQEAYWAALARANSEEQKAIAILTEAAKATAYLATVRNDLGLTTEQSIVLAGIHSGTTEAETMATLRHSQALQVQQASQQATNTAIYQAITGQAALGAALKKAVADSLAGVAARALTEALYMTGIGIAASTPWGAAIYGPPPFWFKAAATMAAVGIAAGAAARVAGAGQGGGGGASSVSSVPATAREIGPSASAQPLPQTINIYIDGNLVDLSQLSRELRPFQIQLTKDTI